MLIILSLFLTSACYGQDENSGRAFYEAHKHLIGLYETADDKIVIGLIANAEIIYFENMSNGNMRFMAALDEKNRWRYSTTRNVTEDTGGEIKFHSGKNSQIDGLFWTDSAGNRRWASRSLFSIEEVQFNNDSKATLYGSLVKPQGDGPFAAAILIPQSDRTDLWDVGMWLLSRGVAVLAYDQRNAESGRSVGEIVAGAYQDRQRQYAEDAIAAVKYLAGNDVIDSNQLGVVGWSGGGFIGAFVAGNVTDLGYYVNIAGDCSPGFEQVSHMFVARLMRQGFSDSDVEAARSFVALHFGVADGKINWATYQNRITLVQDTDWYRYLSSRYSIPFTDKKNVLDIGRNQAEWPPQRVYGQITTVPTLGVFFEYDHSSAPSTPYHFHQSLRYAGNGNTDIVLIPDANHGGFVLNGMGYRFDTAKLTGRSPLLIDSVADWVERQVRQRE